MKRLRRAERLGEIRLAKVDGIIDSILHYDHALLPVKLAELALGDRHCELLIHLKNWESVLGDYRRCFHNILIQNRGRSRVSKL